MRPLNPAEIGEIIKKKIGDLALDAQLKNEGAVLSVNDGIVRIHGLSDAQQGRNAGVSARRFGRGGHFRSRS